MLYPNDNSMIVVERRVIGGDKVTNLRVTKNKIEMGMDNRGTMFWYFNNGVRLTVQN